MSTPTENVFERIIVGKKKGKKKKKGTKDSAFPEMLPLLCLHPEALT